MNSLTAHARPMARGRRSSVSVNAGLKVGDKAPAFTLKNQVHTFIHALTHCTNTITCIPSKDIQTRLCHVQNGRNVSVKPGGKAKVIFFYPKDDSPGCTREAKAFNDAYAEMRKFADVYGISSDDTDSHSAFCSSLDLKYTLLSDEDGAVRKQFGVANDLFGLLPGRETYVIGKDGKVKAVFNNQFSPEKHVDVALKALTA